MISFDHCLAGPLFACNAEGCKKRFAEAAALYIHARVHGDRPYVCHYDGCIKVHKCQILCLGV